MTERLEKIITYGLAAAEQIFNSGEQLIRVVLAETTRGEGLILAVPKFDESAETDVIDILRQIFIAYDVIAYVLISEAWITETNGAASIEDKANKAEYILAMGVERKLNGFAKLACKWEILRDPDRLGVKSNCGSCLTGRWVSLLAPHEILESITPELREYLAAEVERRIAKGVVSIKKIMLH